VSGWWALAFLAVTVLAAAVWRVTAGRIRPRPVARLGDDTSPAGLAYDVPLSYAEARSLAALLAQLACDPAALPALASRAAAYAVLLHHRVEAPRSVDDDG
jgi:hypothetical protein